MNLSETIKNHPLVLIASAFAAGCALTWSFSENVRIVPRDEEIARLEKALAANPSLERIEGDLNECQIALSDSRTELARCAEDLLTGQGSPPGERADNASPPPRTLPASGKFSARAANEKGFQIEIKRCVMTGDHTRCEIRITNTMQDRTFGLGGRSTIFDQFGNEAPAYRIKIADIDGKASRHSAVKKHLLTNTPVNAEIFFRGISPDTAGLPRLRLQCMAESWFDVSFADVLLEKE